MSRNIPSGRGQNDIQLAERENQQNVSVEHGNSEGEGEQDASNEPESVNGRIEETHFQNTDNQTEFDTTDCTTTSPSEPAADQIVSTDQSETDVELGMQNIGTQTPQLGMQNIGTQTPQLGMQNIGTQTSNQVQWFGIGEYMFLALGAVLFVAGFAVPAWEDEKPLSMFYMVFGIFQHSAAKHDPYIPRYIQILFTVVGLVYLALAVLSWILKGCDCPKVGAGFRFLAGLLMVVSVFTYAVFVDNTKSDIRATLFFAFAAGMCSTFGAVCSWASKYEENEETQQQIIYLKTWDKNWDWATFILLCFTLVFMIVTMTVPGWNANPTTVWHVAKQTDTTKVYSIMTVASFAYTGLAMLLLLFGFRNCCNLNCSEKPVTLGIARVLILVFGACYMFAISAFTFDMYRGIDDNALRAGTAFSFGWVTALFYALALCPQFVLIISAASPKANKLDILRYFAYILELILLVGVYFVPIQRNDEPVSMLFSQFGYTKCNSTKAEYIQPKAKNMIVGCANAFFVARVVLLLIDFFVSHRNNNTQHHWSGQVNIKRKKMKVSSLFKLVLAIFLILVTIIFWCVFNADETDMTMVLVCSLGASFALVAGAAAEIIIQQPREEPQDSSSTNTPPDHTPEKENTKSLGQKFPNILHSGKCHMIFGIFLVIGASLELAAVLTWGWKVNNPTTVYNFETTCHSLQAFSMLVLFGLLPCLGLAIVFTGLLLAFACRWKTGLKKCERELILASKVMYLLGGSIFIFATASITLDIYTGVDAGSWSNDSPFILSFVASCVYFLGFSLTFLIVVCQENLCSCCFECCSAHLVRPINKLHSKRS